MKCVRVLTTDDGERGDDGGNRAESVRNVAQYCGNRPRFGVYIFTVRFAVRLAFGRWRHWLHCDIGSERLVPHALYRFIALTRADFDRFHGNLFRKEVSEPLVPWRFLAFLGGSDELPKRGSVQCNRWLIFRVTNVFRF